LLRAVCRKPGPPGPAPPPLKTACRTCPSCRRRRHSPQLYRPPPANAVDTLPNFTPTPRRPARHRRHTPPSLLSLLASPPLLPRAPAPPPPRLPPLHRHPMSPGINAPLQDSLQFPRRSYQKYAAWRMLQGSCTGARQSARGIRAATNGLQCSLYDGRV
jgi:hypothetical protein